MMQRQKKTAEEREKYENEYFEVVATVRDHIAAAKQTVELRPNVSSNSKLKCQPRFSKSG